MKSPIFIILGTTIKRFNEDKCGNFAITISYFALLCAVPLVALFAFVTTRILGNPDVTSEGLAIFSQEFFAQLDPYFFQRVQDLSKDISNLGWFGLAGSFVAASFLFSNLIYSINSIFKADYQKSFFYNRLMEYLIMFSIGIIMLISIFITFMWTSIHGAMGQSSVVEKYINPNFLALINNFFIQYLIPITLTFLVFFMLYKFIPEIKVHTRAALVAAGIATLLWEIFKRIFAFYMANVSAIGIVLSRILQGTLTSIIFFLLWITFSFIILFWGAELAAVLNERIDEKTA